MNENLSPESGLEISQMLFDTARDRLAAIMASTGMEASEESGKAAAYGISAGMQTIMDFISESGALDADKFSLYIRQTLARRNN